MMGHVWKNGNGIVVAAKGSPEHILKICNLTADEKKIAENKIEEMSSQGLRVIAVGEMVLNSTCDIPDTLKECRLELCGMVCLADPPRESVKENIKTCTKAGVRVVMITGDNGITASSIAKQINMPHSDKIITGDDNFSTVVDTIKDGRRIYDNIRKAVGYVFTIHIPIAFASLFAPLLGISPSSLLLLPLHVVLLEFVPLY